MPALPETSHRQVATPDIRPAESSKSSAILADGAVLLALFTVSRLLVWAAGYYGARSVGTAVQPFYLCRFDCFWYLGIASNGYQTVPAGEPPGAANWAFFPLYPLLVRGLAHGLSLDPAVASVLVSNLAFLAALFVFRAYWRHTVGPARGPMLIACALLCTSPGTIYFMAPYTESLFLLLSLCVFHWARTERWLAAGLAAGCLSATRLVGILVIPAMLLIALSRTKPMALLRAELRAPRVMLALGLAPAGLAFFMLHLYAAVGDALAFAHVQTAWGREPGNPLTVLVNGFHVPPTQDTWFAIIVTVALVLSIVGWRHRRYAETLLLCGGVLVPLSTSLFSMPRYVFSLFPLYLLLALSIRTRTVARSAVLAASLIAAGLYAVGWALIVGMVC